MQDIRAGNAEEDELCEYPLADVLRCRALRDYKAEAAGQLEFRKGEIIYVLERHESGWSGGHREDDELTGWFPTSCVEDIAAADGEHPLHRENLLKDSVLASVATPSRAGAKGERICTNPDLHSLQSQVNSERKRCKALEDKLATMQESHAKELHALRREAAEFRQRAEQAERECLDREGHFMVAAEEAKQAQDALMLQNHKLKSESHVQVVELKKRSDRINALEAKLNELSREFRARKPLEVPASGLPPEVPSQPVKSSSRFRGATCDQLSASRSGQDPARRSERDDLLLQKASGTTMLGPSGVLKFASGQESLGLHRGDTTDPAESVSPRTERHRQLQQSNAACGGGDQGVVSMSLTDGSGEDTPGLRRALFADFMLRDSDDELPSQSLSLQPVLQPPSQQQTPSNMESLHRATGTAPAAQPVMATVTSLSGAQPTSVRRVNSGQRTAYASCGSSSRAGSAQRVYAAPASQQQQQQQHAAALAGAASAGTGGGVSKLVSEFERLQQGGRSTPTQRSVDPSPIRHISLQGPPPQAYPPLSHYYTQTSAAVRATSASSASGARAAPSRQQAADTPRAGCGGNAAPRIAFASAAPGAAAGSGQRTMAEDGSSSVGLMNMSPLNRVGAAARSPSSPAPTSKMSVQDRIQLFSQQGR